MVNPGSFKGLRKQFLAEQKDLYEAAVDGKHVADTVADIQRRYFKRFPITLSHTEEPTEEFLASVDDDAPDPELAPPPKDTLDPEAYTRALHVYELQAAELKMRMAQIKRHLHYQYTTAQGKKTTYQMGTMDPMAILMTKLTGNTTQKPRLRTAYNLWGPENRCFVDPVFAECVKEGNVPAKKQATLRSSIYKELFDELEDDEHQEWIDRAEHEHQEALSKIDDILKAGPSTAPEDRQRIIECLPKFVKPMLDLIAEHTGWKVTLLAGGPEPADGGRLNMISVHSGTTSGAVNMNFGRSERVPYLDYVIPTFGKFLKKCYLIQECCAHTLPKQNDFLGLAGGEEQESLEVYSFGHGRAREEEEFVRLAGPHLKSSADRSVDVSGSKTAVKPTAHQRSSSTSTAGARRSSTAPLPSLPIKIGPPKGRKQPQEPDSTLQGCDSTSNNDPAGGNSADKEQEANSPSRDSDSGPSKAPATGNGWSNAGCISCGPTPPISRPPTPPTCMPSMFKMPPGISLAQDLHDASRDPIEVDPPAINPPPAPAASKDPAIVPPESPSLAPAASDATTSTADTLAPLRPSEATSLSNLALGVHVASVERTPPSSNSASGPACASSSDGNLTINNRSASIECTPPPSNSASGPARASSSDGNLTVNNRSASVECTPPPSNSVSGPAHTNSPDGNGGTHPTAAADQDSGTHLDLAASPPPPTQMSAVNYTPTQPPGSASVPDMRQVVAEGAPTGGCKRKGASAVDGSNQKKRKTRQPDQPTSSSSSETFNADTSSVSPVWANNALILFKSVQLGAEWDSLVLNWLEFEKRSKFEGAGKLGTHRRPRAVADWIQRARSPKFRPDIKNVAGFAADFAAWWKSLQPDWRVDHAGGCLRRGDGDWEQIQCPGINGLLSVIAALFFWGSAVQHDPSSASTSWLEALSDVSFAVSHLL